MGKQKENKSHYFKPGQSGNPAGRPKGTRNKVGEAFLCDFVKDWEIGGAYAIEQCRKKDPAAYLRVAASLIPKNFDTTGEDSTLENFLEQFSTVEEIDQFIDGIRALGAAERNKAK